MWVASNTKDMADNEGVLNLQAVRKQYPGFSLEASLQLPAGRTLALLGPSGSGKSTILRLIAGLEAPDSGRVVWAGTDFTPLPPEKRNIGLVFQDYALFPHLSVYENIAFGLREKAWERDKLHTRVLELLSLSGLEAHQRKRPEALSGGEKQRVALTRAMASNPPLLLLDEPLGALDRVLREELLLWLRGVLKDTGATALVVTHDQEEAFLLSDRVAVLKAGRIVKESSPEDLFRNPQTLWLANFLGHKNILSAEQSARLGLAAKPHVLLPQGLELGKGQPGRVVERLFYGNRVGLFVEMGGIRYYWEGASPELLTEDQVLLRVNPAMARPLEDR